MGQGSTGMLCTEESCRISWGWTEDAYLVRSPHSCSGVMDWGEASEVPRAQDLKRCLLLGADLQ